MKVDIKINGHSYKIDMVSTIIYDVVISTDQVKLQQTANEPGLQKQEGLFTVENVRIGLVCPVCYIVCCFIKSVFS